MYTEQNDQHFEKIFVGYFILIGVKLLGNLNKLIIVGEKDDRITSLLIDKICRLFFFLLNFCKLI